MSSEAKLLLECVLPLKALSVLVCYIWYCLLHYCFILIMVKVNHFSAWRIWLTNIIVKFLHGSEVSWVIDELTIILSY